MSSNEQLRKRVEQQARRMKQAEKDRPNLISQTAYIGTLGLVLVLPIVGGAYLGRWLDSMADGYSIRWTLSMLFLGVILGAVNVYLFIRE
jgi:ATP synthase protein I